MVASSERNHCGSYFCCFVHLWCLLGPLTRFNWPCFGQRTASWLSIGGFFGTMKRAFCNFCSLIRWCVPHLQSYWRNSYSASANSRGWRLLPAVWFNCIDGDHCLCRQNLRLHYEGQQLPETDLLEHIRLRQSSRPHFTTLWVSIGPTCLEPNYQDYL